MPKKCPVCGSKVHRDEEEVAVRCQNVSCPAQIKEKIFHFSKREMMDIEGLGESLVNLLVDKGLLSDYADIYYLKSSDLVSLEHLGERSTNNLLSAIEKSKNRPFASLIFALGIRHVGVHSAGILSSNFPSIEELSKADEDRLSQIKEIGPIMAKSIVRFFKEDENLKVIEKLKRAGVRLKKEEEKERKKPLSGLTFVLTGTLENYSRTQASDSIKKAGGKISESVSKRTSYLVVGKEPGSKLNKAKSLGVKTLDERQLKDLMIKEAGRG